MIIFGTGMNQQHGSAALIALCWLPILSVVYMSSNFWIPGLDNKISCGSEWFVKNMLAMPITGTCGPTRVSVTTNIAGACGPTHASAHGSTRTSNGCSYTSTLMHLPPTQNHPFFSHPLPLRATSPERLGNSGLE